VLPVAADQPCTACETTLKGRSLTYRKFCKRDFGENCVFKPPPPVGAGGGYMFSGRPSVTFRADVRPCVRASVRPSVIHVVASCFSDISSICWRIFAKLLSLVHLGTEMNWLDFGVKRSKFKVTAWPNASQIFMFPLYLQYLLIDFRQTFVTGASCDTHDLITFLGQKVKVQGHTITAEAHSTRRYRRMQLFLLLFFVSQQSTFFAPLL